MSIEQLIDNIFCHLRGLDRQIVAKRRSGTNEKMILEGLNSRGLQCPADLLEMYCSCDGTDTAEGDALDEIHFFPGHYWMGLDEALTTYDALVSDERWNADWLPVFANGGGDFYAVICDAQSLEFGGIVGFMLGESEHLIEFKSVTSMLKVIEQSFAEDAFFVAEGHLEANYSRMRMIARRIQQDFVPHSAS